jgi:hypothetical protein
MGLGADHSGQCLRRSDVLLDQPADLLIRDAIIG